jgi:drug/metabolite transporter (DMT)-like permease
MFVLLWSSGAIASELGLRHGSAFALLALRFAIALLAWGVLAARKGRILPEPGTRVRNAFTGFTIVGLYSAFYVLALVNGVTPGVLATLLGAQPILTAFLTEGTPSATRLAGLALAFAGLALVVFDGLTAMRFEALGLACAGLSLAGITAGSILQKREEQAPWEVLPLQYAAGLATVTVLAPLDGLRFSSHLGFVLPVLWLALVISVATTLLLYRLIANGNLVNVTSLFYLVPGVTAAMDWAFLGNPMSALMLAGVGLVMAGLIVAARTAPAESAQLA